MRSVFGLVLIVGLALAGFAVYMVKGFFEQQQMALETERQAAAQMVPTVQVLAVKEAIGYGEPITPENVQIIPYVEAFLPEGVILTQEELFSEGLDVFRMALRSLDVNEPLTLSKVTEPGEAAGISSKLQAGMRAFAINVDVSSGVSGFLRPGDRVDVYWSGSVDSGSGGPPKEFTQLIETSVEIIAVDQSADGSMNEAVVARTITVQATPQQVAALTQAQTSGKLTLSLVGADDDIAATATEVNQESLLGIVAPAAPAPAPAAPEAPKICTIVTRRGAEVIETPIPCSE